MFSFRQNCMSRKRTPGKRRDLTYSGKPTLNFTRSQIHSFYVLQTLFNTESKFV